MSINFNFNAFAGNPLRSILPSAALQSLNTTILQNDHSSSSPNKVLPFRNGRPSVSSTSVSPPIWHLGWINLDDLKGIYEISGAQLNGDLFVYLGSSVEDDNVYWAIDVSDKVPELGTNREMELSFVELRTLMVATDWEDLIAMENLAIAGNVS